MDGWMDGWMDIPRTRVIARLFVKKKKERKKKKEIFSKILLFRYRSTIVTG